ncbi:hypothetical protein FRB90_009887 [Tulasnella sp. 427]|nr:hypothetical protein FRB90_009887 [Tulasnella sp. 427]
MGHTMPFPPFRRTSALSVDELIQIAVKFTSISDNLASLEPQPRSHWEIDLDEALPMNVFGILPNGHYVLVMHREGLFTLWDIRAKGVLGSDRLLARHQLPEETISMEFTTEDLASDETPGVVITTLAQFRIQPTISYARLALQEGFCLTWHRSESERKTFATILDYRNSRRLDLEMDASSKVPPDACLYYGNLVVHHDETDCTAVQAYLNVTQHFQPVRNASGPEHVDTCRKAPDYSAILPLQPPPTVPNSSTSLELGWYSIHPTNTPNENTPCGSPSIFAAERRDPDDPGALFQHLSARWMIPKQTLDILRAGANIDTPLSRRWIDLEGHTSMREEDGFEFLISSTCGLRMLWINNHELEGTYRDLLYFIPLLDPSTGKDGRRVLHLPIDLENTITMDFSDESGTLVVACRLDEDADDDGEQAMESSADQVLHIFQY